MANTQRLCPACEVGTLQPVRKAGRRMPLRQIPDLEIPADFPVPTCDQCGEESFGRRDLAALDAAMGEAYTRALAVKAEQAIRTLGDHVHQRELERLLGLSAGYASKLKNGQSEPGAPLTALLLVLADQPALLDRLRELWKTAEPVEASAPAWPSMEFSSFRAHLLSCRRWREPSWSEGRAETIDLLASWQCRSSTVGRSLEWHRSLLVELMGWSWGRPAERPESEKSQAPAEYLSLRA